MYVRKTTDIWTDIKQQISNLFSERRTHAANWFRYGLEEDEFNFICLSSVVSDEQRALMDQLGDRFFEKKSSLTFRIKDATTVIENYSANFKTSIAVPSHWAGYDSNAYPAVSDERIVNIAMNRKNAMRAIRHEQEALTETVNKVWTTAASVNNFVKLWPPGRDLLPAHIVEKLEERTARSSTSKPVIDTSDLTALNSNLLKAKVAA